jgi:hypothetical protein
MGELDCAHEWKPGEVVDDDFVLPFHWCSKCGTKAYAIAVPELRTDHRIAALEAEVKRLRGALKAVEFVDGQDVAAGMGGMMEQVCPWCDKVATHRDGWAHNPDCVRQAALEPSP